MAPPIDKRTLRAAALLRTPHPKHPTRFYNITEAAKKTGIARSTLHRHIKQAAQAAKQSEGG